MHPFSLDQWYIDAILIFYIISPLLLKITKKYKLYTIAFLSLMAITSSLIPIPWPLNWTMERIATFTLGLWMYEHRKNSINRFILCFGGALFIILPSIAIKKAEIFGNDATIYQILLFCLPMMCFVLNKIKYFGDKIRLSPLVEWIGRYSLEIYLCHALCFGYSQYLKSYDPCIDFLFATILSFIFAFLSKKILTIFLLRPFANDTNK